MWGKLVPSEADKEEWSKGANKLNTAISEIEASNATQRGRPNKKELTAAKKKLLSWNRDHCATAPEKARGFLQIVKDLLEQPEADRGRPFTMCLFYVYAVGPSICVDFMYTPDSVI